MKFNRMQNYEIKHVKVFFNIKIEDNSSFIFYVFSQTGKKFYIVFHGDLNKTWKENRLTFIKKYSTSLKKGTFNTDFFINGGAQNACKELLQDLRKSSKIEQEDDIDYDDKHDPLIEEEEL